METLLTFFAQLFANLFLLFLALICAVGLFLSCLSISGTWLVVIAAALAFVVRGSAFPGMGTVLFFIYIGVLVEVAEYVASFWGVKARGGSGWAGFAALAGGFLGVFVGSALPFPVFGGLIGLMAGSFGLVYLVERIRLKENGRALHIAWGTMWSRLFVTLLKVVATLGMAAWLFAGMLG